jgi:tetratricopeptide (TPR) repeat protein
MKQLSILILLFLSSLHLSAQLSKDTIEFSDPKEIYNQAEIYLFERNYKTALQYYRYLLKKNANSNQFKYKIGLCLNESSIDKSIALPFLESASKNVSKKYRDQYNDNSAPPQTFYTLGLAYHYNHRFEEAREAFRTYKSYIDPKDKEEIAKIDLALEKTRVAEELIAKPVNIRYNNLGDTINTTFPDYAPAVPADESFMIFTSRKAGSTGALLTEDGNFFEDIYMSFKIDGRWSIPVGIGSNINTNGHEATISVSPDGQQLFVYKDEGNFKGALYTSKLEGDLWSKLTRMPDHINVGHTPSVSISADGQLLYFASERDHPGNLDLYFCRKLPNGEWSLPIRLPNTINTPLNEDAPFIHPDGKTLYFSSQAHRHMGGYDIFKTSIGDEGDFSTPENIGYPLNTTLDDIYFYTTPDGKRAYYASYRQDGKGEKDIYMIELLDAVAASMTVLTGNVSTIDNKIPDVVVKVFKLGSNELVGVYQPNKATGKYVIIVPSGENYKLTYEMNDFVFFSEVVEIPTGSEYSEFNKPILLKAIKVK